MRSPRCSLATLLLGASLTACGVVGAGGERDTDDAPTPDEVADPVIVCTPDDEAKRGLTHDHVRRLSRAELALTLQDLIGETLYAEPGIADRIEGLPSDRTLAAGDFGLTPPVGLAGVLSQVAREVADAALVDADWRATHLHPCAEALPLTEACLGDVVESFGGRVWRRPLTVAEIDDLVDFYAASGGADIGLTVLLRRLLQSPSLVFHLEDGTGEVEQGRLRLTDHEVAARISYLTTGGPPDDELRAAADAGELTTVRAAASHVERLLDAASSRERVLGFFRFYTNLPDLPDPPAHVAENAGIDPAGLGQAMTDEAVAFYDDLVFGGGTWSDLMSSTVAHPPTAESARIFGAADAGTVDAPDHPGLLHRPALLVSYGDRTSPIIRGAHLRKLFLCDDLGLPDPVAVEAAQEALGDTSDLTNREAVEALTSDGPCIGCHALVNPLGFAFEGYDQIGVPRDEEVLFDTSGEVVRVFPIDTTVTDLALVEPVPVSVDDSVELAGILAHNAKARQCYSRRIFEYVYRSAMDDDRDRCLVRDVDDQARDGTLRDAFVAAVANADLFWKEDPR